MHAVGLYVIKHGRVSVSGDDEAFDEKLSLFQQRLQRRASAGEDARRRSRDGAGGGGAGAEGEAATAARPPSRSLKRSSTSGLGSADHLELQKRFDLQTKTIFLADNDFFGERSLLTEEPINADVTAIAYCDLMKLPAEMYAEIVEDHPNVMRTILLCSGMHMAQRRNRAAAAAAASGAGAPSHANSSSPLSSTTSGLSFSTLSGLRHSRSANHPSNASLNAAVGDAGAECGGRGQEGEALPALPSSSSSGIPGQRWSPSMTSASFWKANKPSSGSSGMRGGGVPGAWPREDDDDETRRRISQEI